MSGGFNSFESAFNYVSKPTNYEQSRGITNKSSKVVMEGQTIKLVRIEKSDNTDTLFIFFKPSKNRDVWMFWCPDKVQMEYLAYVIPNYIIDVEKTNKKNRSGVHERQDKNFQRAVPSTGEGHYSKNQEPNGT